MPAAPETKDIARQIGPLIRDTNVPMPTRQYPFGGLAVGTRVSVTYNRKYGGPHSDDVEPHNGTVEGVYVKFILIRTDRGYRITIAPNDITSRAVTVKPLAEKEEVMDLVVEKSEGTQKPELGRWTIDCGITQRQWLEQNLSLEAYQVMRDHGMSDVAIRKQCGISSATWWQWQQQFKALAAAQEPAAPAPVATSSCEEFPACERESEYSQEVDREIAARVYPEVPGACCPLHLLVMSPEQLDITVRQLVEAAAGRMIGRFGGRLDAMDKRICDKVTTEWAFKLEKCVSDLEKDIDSLREEVKKHDSNEDRHPDAGVVKAVGDAIDWHAMDLNALKGRTDFLTEHVDDHGRRICVLEDRRIEDRKLIEGLDVSSEMLAAIETRVAQLDSRSQIMRRDHLMHRHTVMNGMYSGKAEN